MLDMKGDCQSHYPLSYHDSEVPDRTATPRTTTAKITAWETGKKPQSPDTQCSQPSIPLPTTLPPTDAVVSSFLSGVGWWFTGSSDPHTIGVPGETKEEEGEEEERTILTSIATPSDITSQISSPRNTRNSFATSNMSFTAKTTQPSTPSPSSSRFTFFSRASNSPKIAQIPANLADDDEFINLNVTSALLPNNSPADPFSPASFNNLLTNAESLLSKLQSAYKLRTLAVHELTREKEAQTDELNEAETRAAHLKTQLEGMEKKLLQSDHDILTIANELAREKQLRAEEREAHEESIQILRAQADSSESRPLKPNQCSLVSRGSRSSFDSYNLDDNESVFSHSRSHTSTSSAGTGITTPELVFSDSDDLTSTPRPSRTSTITLPPKRRSIDAKTEHPYPPAPQRSVFAKILGGGGSASAPSKAIMNLNDNNGLGISEMGCPNCRGASSSVAWDAVGLLREENKHLKDRVSSLEDGVDAALGLIVGS